MPEQSDGTPILGGEEEEEEGNLVSGQRTFRTPEDWLSIQKHKFVGGSLGM